MWRNEWQENITIKCTVIFGVFLFAFASFFQNIHAYGVQEDGCIWFTANLQSTSHFEGCNCYAEVQPCWHEEIHEFDQLIISPAIFYKFYPKTSAWLGYERAIAHLAGQ